MCRSKCGKNLPKDNNQSTRGNDYQGTESEMSGDRFIASH